MEKKQAIIIMCDTQRRDMLSCYYGDKVHTPNLDRLASEGMLFERAYCCDPVCCPARSAIFTGVYPHSNGIWSNGLAIGKDIATLGQRLTKENIYCGYIGKWHVDGSVFGHGKAPDGWAPEWWYDLRNHLESFDDEHRKMIMNSASRGKLPEEMYCAYNATKRAVDFLKQNKDNDFLLVVSYEEPHDPCLCPEPFASMFDGEDVELTLNQNNDVLLDDSAPILNRLWSEAYRDRDFAEVRRRFLSCNAYVDSEIGKLLDRIDIDCPEALTIYTADHGFSLGNRSGMFDKGPSAYEENVGIPLLIRKKGMTVPQTRYDTPVSHIDITPTILDYMGCEQSVFLDGKSLMPIIKDPETQNSSDVFVEFGRFTMAHDGHGGFAPYRTFVTKDYKLCINLLDKDEFYDLRNDPGEVENLIDSPEYEQIRNKMHDRILEWMNEYRDCFRGYHWENRPWRKNVRPQTYHYTGNKRYKRGDPGFTPVPLDYRTGCPIEDFDQQVYKK
jgi:uncharacterized sulfatase